MVSPSGLDIGKAYPPLKKNLRLYKIIACSQFLGTHMMPGWCYYQHYLKKDVVITLDTSL